MTISQTLTTPTTAPARTQDKDTFNTNVDNRLAWQATNVNELTAWAAQANALAAAMNSLAAGGAMTIPYTFSTTTTDSDPGDGVLRLNNAAQNAATVIRADMLASDGSDYGDMINLFDDSTSTIKGFILLQKVTDATKWILFSVASLASPSGYKNITVSVVSSSGGASAFTDGDAIVLKFTRNGDKGETGPAGGVTLGTPVAATSGTSIDFTGIPAGTKRITINFQGVSLDATTQILIQLGDSGGIENTGYVSTGIRLNTGVTSGTSSTAGFIIRLEDLSHTLSGSVVLNLLNSSTFLWASFGGFVSVAGSEMQLTSGYKALSAELTQLRITSVTGTAAFDAGSINISTE